MHIQGAHGHIDTRHELSMLNTNTNVDANNDTNDDPNDDDVRQITVKAHWLVHQMSQKTM